MSDRLDELQRRAEIVVELLKDRHPGLFTWKKYAREAMEDLRLMLPEPETADIAAKAKEHDAKIRREAYLRCAEYLRAVGEPTKRETFWQQFEKWANEADGGEK